MSSPQDDTFPRQYARTQRLTLGEPRNLTVSPDDRRIVFCRSTHGSDPTNCLWVHDVDSGQERLIADPRVLLLDSAVEHLPPAERARRERAREGAAGVVGYATNRDVTAAAFTLDGRLFLAGLLTAASRELDVVGPVFDPRPDPDARRLAYVCGPTLRIAELDGTSRELAGEDDPDVSWGSAEFVAAEEMGRMQGYWWSPDGARIAATRVDTRPVQRWYLGDPAVPTREPGSLPYPSAGTANADVTLHVLTIDGSRVEVRWDRDAYPYLARVAWASDDRLLVTVQSRDQRTLIVYGADPTSGITRELWRDIDDHFVELTPGLPAWSSHGLVSTSDWGGSRRLLIDGDPVTPADIEVRSLERITPSGIWFRANALNRPSRQELWFRSFDGELRRMSADEYVFGASIGNEVVVMRAAVLDRPGTRFEIVGRRTIANAAETPLVRSRPYLLPVRDGEPTVAVLLPRDTTTIAELPVLVDSYGGPHVQRVLEHHDAFTVSQWFADQGFAVVIIDGRGTPGRGAAWCRAVHHDLAGPALDDQVRGLERAADMFPQLDLDHVGIRGWSFGGYLAALAVMRRPDVFHAAVAGAPVTDWRLYDTHYTERYLGDPSLDAAAYERSSLLNDAANLVRPLMLIHGLADDNVVAAHTLQLSSALLAAGRPHEVLPLSGVSHMTPQEVVAENLLRLQLAFLNRHLREPDSGNVAD